ncbi:hypothetical protein HK104_001305, partial [Borealophlyctis nickersoniae]
GSGLHRYTFLLVHQPGHIDRFQGISADELANFDVKAFLRVNGLEIIGANFFQAEVPAEGG